MSEHVERLRAVAGAMPPAPEAMEPFLEKVHERAYTILDRDVAELKAAGIDEDVIFEQTVAAAIREGLRRLDAAERAIG